MKLSKLLCDYYRATEPQHTYYGCETITTTITTTVAPATTASSAITAASTLYTSPSMDTLTARNPKPTEIDPTLTDSLFLTQQPTPVPDPQNLWPTLTADEDPLAQEILEFLKNMPILAKIMSILGVAYWAWCYWAWCLPWPRSAVREWPNS